MRLLFSPFICYYDLLIALGTCWCMRELASAQLKVLRGFAVGEKSEREREREMKGTGKEENSLQAA